MDILIGVVFPVVVAFAGGFALRGHLERRGYFERRRSAAPWSRLRDLDHIP